MPLYEIETFMAAIRRIESNSFEGNYTAPGPLITKESSPYYGQRAYGAYQIMPGNWPYWAAEAGLGGAPITSKAAQDHVARYMFTKYYEKYGDWQLVAIAWFGGGTRADQAVEAGVHSVAGIADVTGYTVGEYYNQIPTYMVEANGLGYGPNISEVAPVSEASVFPEEDRARIESSMDAAARSRVPVGGTYPTPESTGFAGYPYFMDSPRFTDPTADMRDFLGRERPPAEQPDQGLAMRATLTQLLDQLSQVVAGGLRTPVGVPFDQRLEPKPEGVDQEEVV